MSKFIIPSLFIISFFATSCTTRPFDSDHARQEPTVAQSVNDCYDSFKREPAQAAGQCEGVFAKPREKKKVVFDGTSSQLQSLYRKLEFDIEWRNHAENELNYLQFIRKVNLANPEEVEGHASARYGAEHYQAFVRARAFLNSIPEGDFKLTFDTIKRVHSLAYGKDIKPGSSFSGILGSAYSVHELSPFKDRNNYGGDPIKNPLTEAQYEALKANPWIKEFKELMWPLSRKDKRRGTIVYGDSQQVPQKLQQLIDWYESQKGKMDPIELVATFQHAFVSIHPFVDGNGRTSMLLMNRMLQKFDLPPMIFSNTVYDIYMTPKEWAGEVRKGIQEFIEIAQQIEFKDTPTINRNNFADAPTTNMLPEKIRNKADNEQLQKIRSLISSKLKWMENDLVPDREAKIHNIGGQQFLILPDGFFYSMMGIPHVYAEGKLFPVSDRSYLLYSENGETRPTRFSQRRLNPIHRKIFSEHLKLMRAAVEGRIDLEKIEVANYANVAESNNKGQIHLYKWQSNLFEHAIKITEENPFYVLASTRGYNTNFERSVALGMKIGGDEIVAQYQLMDLKFQEYLKYAQAQNNETWIKTIDQSRRKLFTAAKNLLVQVEKKKVQALKSLEDLQALEKQADWMLFQKYLKHTALRFKTFEEAKANMPEGRMIVLRSEMKIAEKMGFRSNQSYLELAQSLPGFESFKKWIIANADNIKNERPLEGVFTKIARATIPGFDSMVPRIAKILQVHKYDIRRADPEFDREFVRHYLHSVNSPLKDAISFSTSTGLYIRFETLADGTRIPKLPFTFEDQPSALYFVDVKIGDEVTFNIGTKYMRQYELLAFDKISSDRIVETVSLTEITEGHQQASEAVRKFLDEDFYIQPPDVKKK